MKRVLITGGAGFIGSHLCQRLLEEGFKVICLDNLITGDIKNIQHLFRDKNFVFKKCDVSKTVALRQRLDYLLHFASPASPRDYLKYPLQTLKAGSLATYNVLELARKKKAIFLLASTSEVYGDPLVHPQKENYWGNVNPVGPRSCYDEAKRFAEALTIAYQRVYNLEVRIARIFNTYGPRMRLNDGRVVPNFIYQALNAQPLTIYGNGKQTRSFCYISDLISAILKLLKVSYAYPVNLGNPREFSILEFAHYIIKLTGIKTKIVYKPLPCDDPRQRRPDIKLAKRLLGWEPKVDLKEGLLETIRWFKENFKEKI